MADKPEKIEIISLSKVTNASLNYLTSRVVGVLIAEPAVEKSMGLKLQEKQRAFQIAIRKKHYPFGATLKEIDKSVDRIWMGTKTQLKINKDNPDPEVAQAANEIWPVFTSTPDPRKLKHKEEYGEIGALIPKLEAFGEEKLSRACILTWVKGLRGAFTAFCELEDEKSNKKAEHEVGLNKKLREELITCYGEIVECLNATIILHPDEAHAKLNAQINQRIAEFRLSDKLGQRKPDEEDDDLDADDEIEEPEEEDPAEE